MKVINKNGKAIDYEQGKEEKTIGWGESVVLRIPIEPIPLAVYGKEIKFLVNSNELYKCQDMIKRKTKPIKVIHEDH